MTRRPAANFRVPAGQRLVATSKTMLLVLVSVGAFITVAIPFQQWFEQRSRLAELQSQLDGFEAEIAQKQAEVSRWADPAFVRSQARDRLHYVLPGEVGYIVLEAEEAPAVAQVVQPAAKEPWYRLVWKSMQDAADTAAPDSESTASE